jgi:hypothetical protein
VKFAIEMGEAMKAGSVYHYLNLSMQFFRQLKVKKGDGVTY